MEVILHKRDEFQKILQAYRPSSEAEQLLSQMPFVILQGITGSGRNAIIDYLVQHSHFHQVVSDTTRPPKLRDGVMEQNGLQYFFRSEDEVLTDLKNGMYLEAELIHNQQVSGISVRELERAHKSGKVPINEVAREGVSNVRRVKQDTTIFFVVPPSFDEWMKRLTGREQMTELELKNRKQSAREELEEALSKDYFHYVVNDTLERVSKTIEKIVDGADDNEENQRAMQAAKGILARLKS